ncbi:MAG: phosphopantetheine-binding protein [Coriobacteriales bacterium]|nr:phosphopantetheine-binding protein [Coriobacteriales bacterium]
MSKYDEIKEIVIEVANLDTEGITADTQIASLNLESYDMLDIIYNIEEKYDIEFGEPDNLNTVQDLVDYVEKLC